MVRSQHSPRDGMAHSKIKILIEKRRNIPSISNLLPDHTSCVTLLFSLSNYFALLKLQVNYGCYVASEDTGQASVQMPAQIAKFGTWNVSSFTSLGFITKIKNENWLCRFTVPYVMKDITCSHRTISVTLHQPREYSETTHSIKECSLRCSWGFVSVEHIIKVYVTS